MILEISRTLVMLAIRVEDRVRLEQVVFVVHHLFLRDGGLFGKDPFREAVLALLLLAEYLLEAFPPVADMMSYWT